MNDATAIANEFILRAFLEGGEIGIMKIVRLTYMSHGFNLVLSDEPLVSTPVDRAPWGADYRSVKKALAAAGSGNVRDLCRRADGSVARAILTDAEHELIDTVWKAYRGYEWHALSAVTRPPSGRLRGLLRTPIGDAETKAYFAGMPRREAA